MDETTTDIICIKCKRDDSDTPNEIVLCDRCGIGELWDGISVLLLVFVPECDKYTH